MNIKKILILFACLLTTCFCGNAGTKNNNAVHANSSWRLVSPMPHGRFGHDAVYAPNGKIYVMGGLVYKVTPGFKLAEGESEWWLEIYRDGLYSNLAFELKTNHWEYVTSIPGLEDLNYIAVYYPDEDKLVYKIKKTRSPTAEQIAELCKPMTPGKRPGKFYDSNFLRMGNGVSIVLANPDTILWLGGADYFGDINDIALAYNIAKDTWPELIKINWEAPDYDSRPYNKKDQREMFKTTMPPMQEHRQNHRAFVLPDGKIYVMGGMQPGHWTDKQGISHMGGKTQVSRTVECYDPKTNTWQYKKPMPIERLTFAAVAAKDGKIYLFGGLTKAEGDTMAHIIDRVDVYDTITDSWSARKPMPVPRWGHAGLLGPAGRIYVLGGYQKYPNSPPLRAVFIYDPQLDLWEKGPDMIVPRGLLAAVETPDGKIYAIGGTDCGAYEKQDFWNSFLPGFMKGYTGKVQDSVEVLDINEWRAAQGKK